MTSSSSRGSVGAFLISRAKDDGMAKQRGSRPARGLDGQPATMLV
jgi:hypothetical protein